jgi:hypothetical protein
MPKPQESRWQIPPAQTGVPYWATAVTLDPAFAGAVDGIVKSGTPYPANDETIVGFVENDVDLSGSQLGASIATMGIINPTYLPVTLDEDAKDALLANKHFSILGAGGFFE